MTVSGHARDRYQSRARCPEDERPPLEEAWRTGKSVAPEPFEEVDGDGGVPDAVRYAPDVNIAIIRRGSQLRTALHGFGFSREMVAAVEPLGYDPKPGEDSLRVPTSEESIRPAIRPVLDPERKTNTAAVTDSRARDPPGFIDEWPAPQPRPSVGAVATTRAVRRVPRPVPEGTEPAIVRIPPSPRTPPGAVQTTPAVRERSSQAARKPTDETAGAADLGLCSFARVREELERLEAAGHDVTAVSIELDEGGATLAVETEE